MTEPSSHEKSQRRRGKEGVTRAKLIEATIRLLRLEGVTALTVARITREAGITQPGLYAHFEKVEDCVNEAVAQVVGTMRENQSAARRRAFERARTSENPLTLEVIRAAYADTIDLALSEPHFAEIFLRYRRDPALLGGHLRQVMDGVRDDLTNDLWVAAKAVGFGAEHFPQVAFYAELVLALYFGAVEALLDGRFTDRKLVYDTLATHTYASLQSTLATVAKR